MSIHNTASIKQNDPPENQQTKPQEKEWWNYGYAWLVFGGPAAVVIASFITAYIAVTHKDPMVDANYYQHGIEINRTLAKQQQQTMSIAERNALAPAVTARNHAATGVNAN